MLHPFIPHSNAVLCVGLGFWRIVLFLLFLFLALSWEEQTFFQFKQCYHRYLSQSRAISCTSTARQYIKDLLESRTKSRYTSSLAYRKNAEAIHGGKRQVQPS